MCLGPSLTTTIQLVGITRSLLQRSLGTACSILPGPTLYAPHTYNTDWLLCVNLRNTVVYRSLAVSFQDLYSLRAPVGNVEGFDISAFDKRVRY